jgi:hypothetical protein
MAIKSSYWARSSNPARCLIPQKDHPQERFATAIGSGGILAATFGAFLIYAFV